MVVLKNEVFSVVGLLDPAVCVGGSFYKVSVEGLVTPLRAN